MKTPPVASLEKSKELAKFVKLDTCFEWVYCWDNIENKRVWLLLKTDNDDHINERVPAPLADELLDVLPNKINICSEGHSLYFTKREDHYISRYEYKYLLTWRHIGDACSLNPADSIITTLIYLYENKLIEVEDGV